ncbi:MAG: ABC transporter ATP-binding protein [Candidatus Brockarchaeota archaeon]|nr:ABC transporter ATP-binding protein [Candidatus Brockarchaeota archaeon]
MLDIRNLKSGYGRMVVLQGVNISVKKGEIVTVLGPNGAGKTTLLNTIFGIATIHEGDILFENRPITSKLHEVVKMGISYAPQLGNVFPNLTVEENLEMGAFIRGNDQAVKDDIKEIFKLFPEIDRRKDQKAKTLSGGERQMLAVARALMSRPKLLLLDEPTAGLSPRAGTALMDKIKEIRDRGVTVLVVEQNVKRALEIADRGYVLVSGRIIREDSAENLMKTDIERLFFVS